MCKGIVAGSKNWIQWLARAVIGQRRSQERQTIAGVHTRAREAGEGDNGGTIARELQNDGKIRGSEGAKRGALLVGVAAKPEARKPYLGYMKAMKFWPLGGQSPTDVRLS